MDDPTPLQKEGMLQRVAVYATWVGVGLVAKVIAEQLLMDDVATLGTVHEDLVAYFRAAFESALEQYSGGKKGS